MNTYLTIMVTVLVITQIIRITQNAFQLYNQNKVIRKELDQIGEVTKSDFNMQRKAYRLLVEYLESKLDPDNEAQKRYE